MENCLIMNDQNSYASSGNGGGKKFLYSGPRKKGVFGDDVDDQQFSFNTNTHNNTKPLNYTPKAEFDIDSIWSIKKNVNAPNTQTSKTNNAIDGWDRNVGKGFYSRHGGNVSEKRTIGSPGASPSGKTWPRAGNSYNYSYGTNASQLEQGTANGSSSNFNKDFTKFGNSGGSSMAMFSPSGQRKDSSVHGHSPASKHLDF